MRVVYHLCLFFSALSGFLSAEEAVDFGRDIRPILSAKCFFCHGPDEEHRKAKLRLDVKENAFANHDGITPFVPGDLAASHAWERITTDDPDELMPPPKAKKPLSDEEKNLLRRWIESGAPWSEHWSFIAPEKSAPPGAGIKTGNPIDAFIREKLSQKKLKPSPPADRRTLIRRLSLDLTGLPPTLPEIDAFVTDQSAHAYEKLVDRLLASPHYGERMALMWLDAARYGDTSVMHADGPRDMWPWRDWVVEAYNANQPYDRFSIEQIAGDLLPNPTLSQKIATGFNRNHPSSDEGGAIAEELRVSYVADRVKTTSNVWLGLSMECAQCHDHKYDPISQKEYYQFYAYFNNTSDPGIQTRKGNQMPMVEVVSRTDESALKQIDLTLEKSKKDADQERNKALAGLINWTKDKDGTTAVAKDAAAQFKNLKHYFPLDEPSGNLLVDARGQKDAVSKTALKSVPGKHGSALALDGKTTYLAPGFTEFDNRSKLTFSAWVKIDAKSSGAILSKMDESKSYRGYDFWIENGRPGIHIVNTWPKNAIKVITDQAIPLNEWQHLAVTYGGGGKPENIKIYVNGEPWKHSVQSGAKALTATIKNDLPFRIGGRTRGAFFKGQLDDVRVYDRALLPAEIKWSMADSTGEALQTDPTTRRDEQYFIIGENYLAQTGTAYRKARSAYLLAQLARTELTNGKTTTMVMGDNPSNKKRVTYILNRGAYDSPKKEQAIEPQTPAALPPLPENAPPNRLTLANWLFTDQHPLTARVTANQLWQLFFGTGIVSTPGDFGAQGDFPTHPELLDWLAVDFRESGWDIKRLIKQIVLSETYRQSSNLRPADLQLDLSNRYLARAPRFRLPAEMIRDNALQLGGLLVKDIGGPGVKPYQPPGLWAEVGLGGNPKFVQDREDKLFRRSIYTYWKRSAPHPAMVIFDAPNRETCVLKRPNTNTPLQALAAMNDVQMVEASRHLAERILKEGGETNEAKASFGLTLATARVPEPGEVATVLKVLEKAIKAYREDSEKGNALLSAGESKRDESLDQSLHAAWTLVAGMILNLDEVLTRN